MLDIIIIPENPTLDQLRKLLAEVSNQISTRTETLAMYKVDLANAKNAYKRALAAAKVNAIKNYSLKPSNQTMVNAYALSDPAVTAAEQQLEVANAIHELGSTEMETLKETSMALKKMIGSVCDEIRATVYGGHTP